SGDVCAGGDGESGGECGYCHRGCKDESHDSDLPRVRSNEPQVPTGYRPHGVPTLTFDARRGYPSRGSSTPRTLSKTRIAMPATQSARTRRGRFVSRNPWSATLPHRIRRPAAAANPTTITGAR